MGKQVDEVGEAVDHLMLRHGHSERANKTEIRLRTLQEFETGHFAYYCSRE